MSDDSFNASLDVEDGHRPSTTRDDANSSEPDAQRRDVPRPNATVREPTRNDALPTFDDGIMVEEAVLVLDEMGVRRSRRIVQRYCQQGELESVKDPDEGRWMVSRESVEELGKRLKIKDQLAGRSYQVDPREQPSESIPQPSEVEELRRQLRDLEINNRVKDQVIDRYEQEIQGRQQIEADLSYQLGAARQQLLTLGESVSEEAPSRIVGDAQRRVRELPTTRPVDDADGRMTEHAA